jgi:hypothetical protein
MHTGRWAANVLDSRIVHLANAVREWASRIDDAFSLDVPFFATQLVLGTRVYQLIVFHDKESIVIKRILKLTEGSLRGSGWQVWQLNVADKRISRKDILHG